MVRNEEQKAQRQFQTDSKYLDSLTPMEKERLNETRWVTVRQGDTLYNIAERVYNDGWLYRKLFETNPQVLANPDLITPGQRLRVPL
jgi:nucleoid-associated protein YgaU